MKLYTIDLSPFAARVRAALYFKKLNVELVPPPAAGLKSPEYRAINPLGRLPALVLDDGQVIPESETIVEFLEDAFPVPSLRPSSASDRARVRLLARIAECYINAPMFVLFPQLGASPRDQGLVESQLGRVDEGLGYLAGQLSGGRYAFGNEPTTADCCVYPTLYLTEVIGPMFGRSSLLTRHPKVLAYYQRAQEDPVISRIQREMTAAMKASVVTRTSH